MRYRYEESQRQGDRGQRPHNGYRFQGEDGPPFVSYDDDDDRPEYATSREGGEQRGDFGPRRYGERDYGQRDWEGGQHPFGYGPPSQRPGGQPRGWGRGGRSRQPGYSGQEHLGPEQQGDWSRSREFGGSYGRRGEFGARPYGGSQGQYDEGQLGGEFSGGTPRGWGVGGPSDSFDEGRFQTRERFARDYDFRGREGYGGRISEAHRRGPGESFRGRGPQSYTRSDDRIREEICDVLTDDDAIDATNIDVQVVSGEITLTGTVRDRESKRCAEDIAESVSGVRNVQNQLRVQSAGGTQGTVAGGGSSGSQGTSTTSGGREPGKR